MRSARRLLLAAMVSSVFVFQAGAAGAEKGGAAPQQKGPGVVKRGLARAKQSFQRRFGVRSELRALKFGVGLKLQQGDLVTPTVMLKDPALIGLSGGFNARERRAVKGAQKKVNRAWRNQAVRELGPGVPGMFNQPGMAPPQGAPEPQQQPAAQEKDVEGEDYPRGMYL